MRSALAGLLLATACAVAPSIRAQAVEAEVAYGRDYTFERQVAKRRVRDAEDRGTIRLVTYVYRPVKNDRHEVVLFSHASTGGLSRAPDEPGGSNAPPASVVQYFVARGYTVVAPMRRGRGESSGTYVEECSVFTGACTLDDQVRLSERALREALLDTNAVIDQLVLGKLAPRGSKLLLVGHSRGGFLSLMLAADRPGLVSAVIDFAGGWHGITARMTDAERRARSDDHDVRLARAAPLARVPTLWLYAPRDPLYVDGVPQAMHAAWTEAGGRGELVMLPAESLANPHLAVNEPRLWRPHVDAFLATLAGARQGR